MRPRQPWGDVVHVLNHGQAAHWTVERLRRTVRRLASEGIVDAALLDRARPQLGDDRLIRLVAGIKAAAPIGAGAVRRGMPLSTTNLIQFPHRRK
jgi:hypothetical protein